MIILRNPNGNVVAGCYSPCQQGSSGGNKILKKDNLVNEPDKQVVIAGCYSPCQQGSSGGNKILKVG